MSEIALRDTTERLTMAVVIPALNESRTIESTLRRLVAQDEIDEIIVVDNGSTDDTPAIVQTFSTKHPKVQLLQESKRGISPARNAGFNLASTDIIARTDADTLVSDNWAHTIRTHFAAHPDTAAVTGLCTYHDSPIGVFLRVGQWLLLRAGMLGGGPVANMYGPNMAIRTQAWQSVKLAVSNRPDVTEDLDLALTLFLRGFRIDQVPSVRAQTSSRRRRTSPRNQWRFHMVGVRTARLHGIEIPRQSWAIIVGATILHTAQWPIYRFWNFEERRFSLNPGAQRMTSVGDPRHA